MRDEYRCSPVIIAHFIFQKIILQFLLVFSLGSSEFSDITQKELVGVDIFSWYVA